MTMLGMLLASKSAIPDFNAQLPHLDARRNTALAELIAQKQKEFDMVGVTAAIIIDGHLAAASAVGLRRIGSKYPLVVTDPMHIGSNTKGMTALIFARLVEAGKLRFNETIREAFPFSTAPEYRDVPLSEFLYQRSGFGDESVPDVFDKKYFPRDRQGLNGTPAQFSVTRQAFAQDCLNGKPSYPTGSKHLYHNENFVVIGAAEELATNGTPWEELMRREVFGPLHMKTAGFGPMGRARDVSAPWQHLKEDGKWEPIFHDNPGYFGPAGTVHCSVLDLANYAYAQTQGALGKGDYLKPETWRTLQTPPKDSYYACGLVVGPPNKNGIRVMGHNGSNTMSFSEWWASDEGRVVVVAMTNCMSLEGCESSVKGMQSLAKTWLKD